MSILRQAKYREVRHIEKRTFKYLQSLHHAMAGIPFVKVLFSTPGLIAILVIIGFILHLSGQSLLTVFLTALFVGLVLFIGKGILR